MSSARLSERRDDEDTKGLRSSGLGSSKSAVPHDIIARVSAAFGARRVLVTGGMSFIGSHLVEALVASGADTVVADDLSSGREENLAAVRNDIRFLRGDLRDADFAKAACAGVEIVFHLAAAHGGRGYIDTHPVECLSNISLDHTVLSTAVAQGAQRIVFAGSACAYPTTMQSDDEERLLLSEEDADLDRPNIPDGEYGWYKLTGEMQLRAFHRQFGIDGIACRIFTAYGERENESHAAVALIAKAVARLDPYPIWGDGRQTRNFTYVGDTASGLLLSGALLSGFDVVNVGTSSHHTINELAELIFELSGWSPRRIERQLDRPVGVRSRAADVSKCRRLLDWSPRFSLEEGVRRTLDWYAARATPEQLRGLESLLMTR
jgi:nucleoside-diphosphate-sugar epimerase